VVAWIHICIQGSASLFIHHTPVEAGILQRNCPHQPAIWELMVNSVLKKAPSPNIQAPEKLQAPGFKGVTLLFGTLGLVLLWSLVLGIWSFFPTEHGSAIFIQSCP
jgi:hypothetical protein